MNERIYAFILLVLSALCAGLVQAQGEHQLKLINSNGKILENIKVGLKSKAMKFEANPKNLIACKPADQESILGTLSEKPDNRLESALFTIKLEFDVAGERYTTYLEGYTKSSPEFDLFMSPDQSMWMYAEDKNNCLTEIIAKYKIKNKDLIIMIQ